jgi:hypothetical protein
VEELDRAEALVLRGVSSEGNLFSFSSLLGFLVFLSF